MKLKAIGKDGHYLENDYVSENFCDDLAELLDLYDIEMIRGATNETGDSVIAIRFSDGSTRDIIQVGGLN